MMPRARRAVGDPTQWGERSALNADAFAAIRARFPSLFPLLVLVALALSACGGPHGAASTAARSPAGIAPLNAAGGSVARPATSQAAASVAQSASLPDLQVGQMLIRTAAIEIEADNPAGLVTGVRQIAASAIDGADAGYVSDEKTQFTGNVLTASVTIRVPATSFAAVMDQLRKLGTRVVSETSNTQDVTEQFVDVDARLHALQATQAQLLQLLAKSQRLDDTLAVQRQITDVNTQIEQLVGRENYLKNHSAFSTITVTIQPGASAAVLQPGWSAIRTLMAALTALGAFGHAVADALIWLAVFGLPLATLSLIVVLLQRAVSRALRERRSRAAGGNSATPVAGADGV